MLRTAQAAPTTSCRQKGLTTSVNPQRFIQTCWLKHTHLSVCVCVWEIGKENGMSFCFFYLTSPFCALSQKTWFAAEWVFIWMVGGGERQKDPLEVKQPNGNTTINQEEVWSFSCQWMGVFFWGSLLYVHVCACFCFFPSAGSSQ